MRLVALAWWTVVVAVMLPLVCSAWAPDWNDDSWPLAALGRPCGDASLGRADVRLLCGAGGRAAGIVVPVDMFRVPAHGERVLVQRASSPFQASLRVSLHERLVVIRAVTCGACERVMGRAWLFDPATVAATDLATAQHVAGLPTSPPLRSVSAWQAAQWR